MTNAIDFKAVLIRNPLKPKSDDWQETAHKWAVFINGQEFDYYTGLAHRIPVKVSPLYNGSGYSYKELTGMSHRLLPNDFKELLHLSMPTQPKLDDVLHSIIMDASASEMSFSEWCSDCGYDTDSRKALATYELCQQNADKLRKAGVNIAVKRERLKDY